MGCIILGASKSNSKMMSLDLEITKAVLSSLTSMDTGPQKRFSKSTVTCCNIQCCCKSCAFVAYRGKPEGCQDISLDYSSFSFLHTKLSHINFAFSTSIPKESKVNFKNEWEWHNIKGHSRDLHFHTKSYQTEAILCLRKRSVLLLFFSEHMWTYLEEFSFSLSEADMNICMTAVSALDHGMSSQIL